MSMLSVLIPGLLASHAKPSYANTGRAAGGASELYGKTEGMILSAIEGSVTFTVPALVSITGIDRCRVNRTLKRLAAKGLVTQTLVASNGYSQPAVWRKTCDVQCPT